MRTFSDQVKAALKIFANDARMPNMIRDHLWYGSEAEAGREVIAALNEGDAMAGGFWFELEFFVELMLPVYELLRMSDGKTRMSKFFNSFLKLPHRWDEICRQQAAASNAHEGQGWKDPAVLERLVDVKEKGAHRLEYVWNPMMSAAFALDPEFRSVDLHTINGGQILVDLHTIYERLLINHGTDSKAAIEASSEESDGGPVGRAGGQFHLFRTGKWKGASFLGYAKEMSPADWWEQYGIGMPELAKVAIRVTSKSPTLPGRERNWSLYGGKAHLHVFGFVLVLMPMTLRTSDTQPQFVRFYCMTTPWENRSHFMSWHPFPFARSVCSVPISSFGRLILDHAR